MKRKTPLVTLLTGAALGVILLIASMLTTPKAPARSAAAVSPAPASTVPSPASPTPATTAVANVPARADYAGKVSGGGASVAISVHGGQAIGYVCHDSVIETLLKGTTDGGRLTMTGKNRTRLSATYNFKKAAGDIHGNGIRITFSARALHKSPGLDESIRDHSRCQDQGEVQPSTGTGGNGGGAGGGGGDDDGGGHGGGSGHGGGD
jgi:serine/threonine-protein kinase